MASIPLEYASIVRDANERLAKCRAAEGFDTGIPEAEQMLQDLDRFPHHFVLACLMYRQFDFRRAWAIPYRVGVECGGFKLSDYEKLDLQGLQSIFVRQSLHRFTKEVMPAIFLRGVQRIARFYDRDAKNIWVGNPPAHASSAGS